MSDSSIDPDAPGRKFIVSTTSSNESTRSSGGCSLDVTPIGKNDRNGRSISRATGLGYQKPSAILAPVTARVGFRFIF